MPLVEVEFVGGIPEQPAALAKGLADALAVVMQTGPAQTWVRLRGLPVECYAENGVEQPDGAAAVFVTITKRTLPEQEVLREEAAGIAVAVARVCGREASLVHVIYEPPGRGRIAFGGVLSG